MLKYTVLLLILISIPTVIFAQLDNGLWPGPGTCGTLKPNQAGSGLSITELDEFPWMARIVYNMTLTPGDAYRCLAVLINRQYLLTNAHCFNYRHLEAYAVVLGDWNTANSVTEIDCDEEHGNRCMPSGAVQKRVIGDITIHVLYSSIRKENDIALLKLDKPIEYSDYIRPICLPTVNEKQNSYTEQNLTLAGWLAENETRKSKLASAVISLNECRQRFYTDALMQTVFGAVKITDSHLCAFSCDNDVNYRGGSALMGIGKSKSDPAADYYFLIGLPSFGIACSYPDVFTRNDVYLTWIKENVY